MIFLIECSGCKKLFGVMHACDVYYCPYCGVQDTVAEDADYEELDMQETNDA